MWDLFCEMYKGTRSLFQLMYCTNNIFYNQQDLNMFNIKINIGFRLAISSTLSSLAYLYPN